MRLNFWKKQDFQRPVDREIEEIKRRLLNIDIPMPNEIAA